MANLYSHFYQFTEDPFSLAPDPRFFYTSATYQEALMGILYGVTQRRGLSALLGQAGLGKTTLLHKVKERLESSVRTISLLNPRVSFDEILEYRLQELDMQPRTGKKLPMLQQLHERLLEESRQGNTVVFFIDEAQSL